MNSHMVNLESVGPSGGPGAVAFFAWFIIQPCWQKHFMPDAPHSSIYLERCMKEIDCQVFVKNLSESVQTQ